MLKWSKPPPAKAFYLSYLILKAEFVCLVCFFVLYAQRHCSADLDKIWQVASLHSANGHGL